MEKVESAKRSKRVRRVEYEAGWGWIARNKDGAEIMPDFRWASRSVARDVVATTDMLAAQRAEPPAVST